MQGTRFIRTTFSVLLAAPLCLATSLYAQSSAEHHGRKYKAPPETSHMEVHVTKKSNGKPIVNAAVVFNPTKDGKDLGSMEVKTDPEGKAALDIIPTGSVVRVQVIASGFATFAADFTLDVPSRSIDVALLRPQEQASSYIDNSGKDSTRK
ncbi:MAG TPA: carboxypeptidase-like regulatory domain-containing protein, partial [Edaphobacter sp.]